MKLYAQWTRVAIVALGAGFLTACAATKTERNPSHIRTLLQPDRTCVLRSAADTASFAIVSRSGDAILISRLVMTDANGDRVNVPLHMLVAERSNVVIDLQTDFSASLEQDTLHLPLSAIHEVHTEEFDLGTTMLVAGGGLLVTAGLMYAAMWNSVFTITFGD